MMDSRCTRKRNVLLTITPMVWEKVEEEARKLQLAKSVVVELILRKEFNLLPYESIKTEINPTKDGGSNGK